MTIQLATRRLSLLCWRALLVGRPLSLVDDIKLLGRQHQRRDYGQAEEGSTHRNGLWGSVALVFGTGAVERVHVMGATALDAALIIHILIPDESAATDDSHFSIDWKIYKCEC